MTNIPDKLKRFNAAALKEALGGLCPDRLIEFEHTERRRRA